MEERYNNVTLHLAPAVHEKIALMAVLTGQTISQLVSSAILDWAARKDHKVEVRQRIAAGTLEEISLLAEMAIEDMEGYDLERILRKIVDLTTQRTTQRTVKPNRSAKPKRSFNRFG